MSEERPNGGAAACPKCDYFDDRELPAESVCHTAGGGEFVVICPRCRHDGPFRARPEWAVEAWNEAASTPTLPANGDDLVERLHYISAILEANKDKFAVPDHIAAKVVTLQQAATRIRAQEAEIEGLRDALRAIEQTAFIGATTTSDETLHVSVESAHDIARQALSQATDGDE
jgi:GGDEF domain-containing protein